MPVRTVMKILCMVPVLLLPLSCGKDNKEAQEAPKAEAPSSIHAIASEDEFKRIVEGSGDRLLAFDLYANWCMPCRMLSPVLEKIATENSSRVSIFKINLEYLPIFSQTFNVDGIPHVAFMKKKAVVENVIGRQPEQTYLDIIKKYSPQ